MSGRKNSTRGTHRSIRKSQLDSRSFAFRFSSLVFFFFFYLFIDRFGIFYWLFYYLDIFSLSDLDPFATDRKSRTFNAFSFLFTHSAFFRSFSSQQPGGNRVKEKQNYAVIQHNTPITFRFNCLHCCLVLSLTTSLPHSITWLVEISTTFQSFNWATVQFLLIIFQLCFFQFFKEACVNDQLFTDCSENRPKLMTRQRLRVKRCLS